MIGQLRGALVDKRPNQVIIDAGGVGYQVQIPLSTFAGLGALHAEITLLIHTHLREDQIALYGFLTAREKQLFEMLISASGVGPSLALKILSGMGLDDLVPAIRKGDVLRLKQIPGVGQKTAERIILELRDKLAAVEVIETGKPATRSQVELDATSALLNLGYDNRAVDRAIKEAQNDAVRDLSSLVAAALQRLEAVTLQKGDRNARDD